MATTTQIRTAIGAVALSVLIAAAGPALACAPEVKFDPETGIALPNPELDAALREIKTRRNVAETG